MNEIKNYDEMLDTLKNVRNYLKIARADDCVDELDKVAKYLINKNNNNPTLDECIKEWEEKGYTITLSITHMWVSTVDDGTIASFDLCDKCVITSLFINYELSILITKTLKALGWFE